MPTLTIPRRRDWHTYAVVFGGVILLVWLSSESTYMPLTALLGVGTALGLAMLALMVRFGGRVLAPRIWLPGVIILGAVIGVFAIFTTTLLMLFKNVQHSHLYPDFPGEVFVELWRRTPAWGLAGALLGAAWGLARLAFYTPNPPQ
jgi:hypothetical protein